MTFSLVYSSKIQSDVYQSFLESSGNVVLVVLIENTYINIHLISFKVKPRNPFLYTYLTNWKYFFRLHDDAHQILGRFKSRSFRTFIVDFSVKPYEVIGTHIHFGQSRNS